MRILRFWNFSSGSLSLRWDKNEYKNISVLCDGFICLGEGYENVHKMLHMGGGYFSIYEVKKKNERKEEIRF